MKRLYILLLTLCVTQAYKILIVFPLPGKSHVILGNGIVKHLLDAGHEVTYITPYPRKDAHPNLQVIDISSVQKFFPEDILTIKAVLDKSSDLADTRRLFNGMKNMTATTFEDPNVQKLLRDTNLKFDLIIIDWMMNEVFCGFAAVFECPYVWFSTVEPHSGILRTIEEGVNPAYTASVKSETLPPFTFKQRVVELFNEVTGVVFKNLLLPTEKADYKRFFDPVLAARGRVLTPYDDLRYNASLVLGNSHFSIGSAIKLPANYIAIAGFHIDSKVAPLPKDLKTLMDKAKNGVIYFSMGSIFKSKDMPDALVKSIGKMFGELKQEVIWKYEEILPDMPSNVHIVQWAPQHSILAHPNCKLFITHGGLLSITEAIHFGVPVVGIPVFADQFINIKRAIGKGFAKTVELAYSMADQLKVTIEEILSEPRFAEKAKQLSSIYNDRLVPPSKELVYWVEHVVRTRGASHLRSPAWHLPFYKKAYLDLAALIIVLLLILSMVCKGLLSLYLSRKVDVDKKQN